MQGTESYVACLQVHLEKAHAWLPCLFVSYVVLDCRRRVEMCSYVRRLHCSRRQYSLSETNPPSGAMSVAHDIDLSGIALHYVTWGTRTTPERVVLLIHGITANSQYWNIVGPALAAQGWYAIAPDLRGRGLSGKPSHGYGIPYHASDLLALCDALHLTEVNVIGHSLGAQIALFVAAIHPQRVGRLVLGDGGGKLPEDWEQTVASSLMRLGVVYSSLDAYIAAIQRVAVFPWSSFWDQYFRYDAEVHSDGTVSSRMPRHALVEESAVMMATRTEALPADVRAPTLIARAALGTRGPDQGFILPRDEAERMQAMIAGSRVVEIPETNHYTIVLSERFIAEVLAFLKAGS